MAKLATFQNPIFQDETKAREALEAVRWPDGPYLPSLRQFRSGQDRQDRRQEAVASSRPVLLQRVQGPVHRDGWHRV